MDHAVIPVRVADDHPLDARVDDESAAHGAGGGVVEELPGLGLPARQVQGGAQGVPPGGRDDGVHLRVDRAAQLIALAAGHVHGLPGAVAQVHAVLPATGRAVIAGGDDLVVFDDDGSIAPPHTGGPLQHGLGDIQVIVLFVDALHTAVLPVHLGKVYPILSPGARQMPRFLLFCQEQFTLCLRLLP